MQTITLTRQFSGFKNLPDTWIVGANDEKPCTIKEYELPDGYKTVKHSVSGDTVIVDPAGAVCEIITHYKTKCPQLLSGYGTSPVLDAITDA